MLRCHANLLWSASLLVVFGACSVPASSHPVRSDQLGEQGASCLTSFDCGSGLHCGDLGLCAADSSATGVQPVAPPPAAASPAPSAAAWQPYFEALRSKGLALLDDAAIEVENAKADYDCGALSGDAGAACWNSVQLRLDTAYDVLEARESLAAYIARREPAETTATTALINVRRDLCSPSERETKVDLLIDALGMIGPERPYPYSNSAQSQTPSSYTPDYFPTGGVVVTDANGARVFTDRFRARITQDQPAVMGGQHFYLPLADVYAAVDGVVNDGSSCTVPESIQRGRLLTAASAVHFELSLLRQQYMGLLMAEPALDVNGLAHDLGSRGSLSSAAFQPKFLSAMVALGEGIADARERIGEMSPSLNNVKRLMSLSVVRDAVLSDAPGFETVDRAAWRSTTADDVVEFFFGAFKTVAAITSVALLLIGNVPGAAAVGWGLTLVSLPIFAAEAVWTGLAYGAMRDYRAGGLVGHAQLLRARSRFRWAVASAVATALTISAVQAYKIYVVRRGAERAAEGLLAERLAEIAQETPPPPVRPSDLVQGVDDIPVGTVVQGHYIDTGVHAPDYAAIVGSRSEIIDRYAQVIEDAFDHPVILRDALPDGSGYWPVEVFEIPIPGNSPHVGQAMMAELTYAFEVEVGMVLKPGNQYVLRFGYDQSVMLGVGETVLIPFHSHPVNDGGGFSATFVRTADGFALWGGGGDLNVARTFEDRVMSVVQVREIDGVASYGTWTYVMPDVGESVPVMITSVPGMRLRTSIGTSAVYDFAAP